jgi:hypothetical protein
MCERVLARVIGDGKIVYVCSICGETVNGDPRDVHVMGASMHAGENIMEKYGRLLDNAAFDRVNLQVPRTCVKCGLDYMTQVRVGDAEHIIWVCKCGNREQPT